MTGPRRQTTAYPTPGHPPTAGRSPCCRAAALQRRSKTRAVGTARAPDRTAGEAAARTRTETLSFPTAAVAPDGTAEKPPAHPALRLLSLRHSPGRARGRSSSRAEAYSKRPARLAAPPGSGRRTRTALRIHPYGPRVPPSAGRNRVGSERTHDHTGARPRIGGLTVCTMTPVIVGYSPALARVARITTWHPKRDTIIFECPAQAERHRHSPDTLRPYQGDRQGR